MSWAALAASAYGAGQGDAGGGGGGAMPSPQSQESATSTTVSPTFQQSFTPQVSPVIQVSTGSGDQRAAATQSAPGGQSAEGGSGAPAGSGNLDAPGGGASAPFMPGPSYRDPTPPADAPAAGVFQENDGASVWKWTALGALVLGVGYAVYSEVKEPEAAR